MFILVLFVVYLTLLSVGEITVSSELERISREMVMAYFESICLERECGGAQKKNFIVINGLPSEI
jgi:hypothetical protein